MFLLFGTVFTFFVIWTKFRHDFDSGRFISFPDANFPFVAVAVTRALKLLRFQEA